MWELLIIAETTLKSSVYLTSVQQMDSSSLSPCGMETYVLHKVNLDLKKLSKKKQRRNNGLSGALSWNHFVMKTHNDSSGVSVSG